MQNKIKKILSILVSLAVMIPSATAISYAGEEAPINKVSLSGSIEWDDEDNAEKQRPESVTIHLYENDVLKGTQDASESSGWQFSFDVDSSDESESTEGSRYRVEQQIPDNYSETEHRDPVLDKGTIICDSWDKYTPCNELTIPSSKLGGVIVGKLTGKYADQPTAVVWTKNALSDDERSQISSQIRNMKGIGNPKNIEFYSGDDVSVPAYGLSINATAGQIKMDKPDCWALFSGAEYTKKYSQISPAVIRNKYTPVLAGPVEPNDPPTIDPPVVEEPYEPITPTDPITPPMIEDIIEDQPDPSDPPLLGESAPTQTSKDKSQAKVAATSAYPKTADANSIMLWVSMATLAAMLIIGLASVKRRIQ